MHKRIIFPQTYAIREQLRGWLTLGFEIITRIWREIETSARRASRASLDVKCYLRACHRAGAGRHLTPRLAALPQAEPGPRSPRRAARHGRRVTPLSRLCLFEPPCPMCRSSQTLLTLPSGHWTKGWSEQMPLVLAPLACFHAFAAARHS